MKKLTFAALLAALLSWPLLVGAAGPELPLDRKGYPIPVLKFAPSGSGTMYIPYDGTTRAGLSNDASASAFLGNGTRGTMIIRIWCDTDAHIAIETDSTAVPTATTRDTPVTAKVSAFVKITSSNDRFAVIQNSATGICWFTPLL